MAEHFKMIEPSAPGIDARSSLVYERAVQRTKRLNLRAQQMRRDLRADASRQDPSTRPVLVRSGPAWRFVVRLAPISATAFLSLVKGGADAPSVKSLRW